MYHWLKLLSSTNDLNCCKLGAVLAPMVVLGMMFPENIFLYIYITI